MTANQILALTAPLITGAVAISTALIVKRLFIHREKVEIGVKTSAPVEIVGVNASKQQIIDELERAKNLIDRALRSISTS